jgi:hypothetical protein
MFQDYDDLACVSISFPFYDLLHTEFRGGAGSRKLTGFHLMSSLLSSLSLAMSAKKELWLSLEVSGQNSTIIV